MKPKTPQMKNIVPAVMIILRTPTVGGSTNIILVGGGVGVGILIIT
jgi:hypothetical protein